MNLARQYMTPYPIVPVPHPITATHPSLYMFGLQVSCSSPISPTPHPNYCSTLHPSLHSRFQHTVPSHPLNFPPNRSPPSPPHTPGVIQVNSPGYYQPLAVNDTPPHTPGTLARQLQRTHSPVDEFSSNVYVSPVTATVCTNSDVLQVSQSGVHPVAATVCSMMTSPHCSSLHQTSTQFSNNSTQSVECFLTHGPSANQLHTAPPRLPPQPPPSSSLYEIQSRAFNEQHHVAPSQFDVTSQHQFQQQQQQQTSGVNAAVAAAGLLAVHRLAGLGPGVSPGMDTGVNAGLGAGLLDPRQRAHLHAAAHLSAHHLHAALSASFYHHRRQHPHQFAAAAAAAAAAAQFLQSAAAPLFTLSDLDLVLYGYMRSRSTSDLQPVNGHSLSGLRINELSYGMDRILSGCAPVIKTSAALRPDPTCIDLPEGLELRDETFGGAVHYGVFCSTFISRSTRYGPFTGKLVNTSEIKTNDDNSFMWEIFKDGRLSHFIDGRGTTGNWMSYVNCARHSLEQNLVAIQYEGHIYYEVCQDLKPGNELLVWYDAECYVKFMGIPISLKDSATNDSSSLQQTTADDCETSAGYQCERCGKVFAYQYYRDKHLKYTRCVDQGDRKFPCHLCTRSFEKRDRLRIHILHVHEKHRPHKCVVCAKSFSQSSSLNKHMRVHSGERPYKCVYCSKAFTASSILRTHIRQHSGEKPFKCKHCGKPFASHAAHDSHVRRTHSKMAAVSPVVCSICARSFTHTYELEYHLRSHDDKHLMTYCDDSFSPRDVVRDLILHEKCDETIDVVGVDMTGRVRAV